MKVLGGFRKIMIKNKSKGREIKLVISQGILYCLLFFSIDNKTFFIPIGLFSVYLFWILEDWKQALWLTLVAVLPFNWGLRNWIMEIPMSFNFLPGKIQQKFSYFSLSAKFLIAFFLVLMSLPKNRKSLNLRKKDIFLILFFVLSLLSTILASNNDLALVGLLRLSQGLVIYYLSRFFLNDSKILRLSVYSLISLVIFEGGLATVQFLLNRPVGKIIEESLLAFPYGKTTAESIFLTRASGSFTDPNTLAVFLLAVIPLILTQAVYKYPLIKNRLLIYLGLLLGLLGLIFTFSRAAWVVFSLFLVVFIYYLKKEKRYLFNRKILFIPLVVVIPFLGKIVGRMLTLRYSLWGGYSSGKARIQLIREALEIIKQKPLIGVGLEGFLPAMMANNVTGVIEHFLFPVHNLYLLLASELGLPALGCFIVFIVASLRDSLKHKTRDKEILGVKLGVQGGIINYLLAILVYIGGSSNLDLFFLLLGMLANL